MNDIFCFFSIPTVLSTLRLSTLLVYAVLLPPSDHLPRLLLPLIRSFQSPHTSSLFASRLESRHTRVRRHQHSPGGSKHVFRQFNNWLLTQSAQPYLIVLVDNFKQLFRYPAQQWWLFAPSHTAGTTFGGGGKMN